MAVNNETPPLTNGEKLALIGLKESDPFYIDKLTIRELKYLISMIDAQERQWSVMYRTYYQALKKLEETDVSTNK
jgi:hypothetical protein